MKKLNVKLLFILSFVSFGCVTPPTTRCPSGAGLCSSLFSEHAQTQEQMRAHEIFRAITSENLRAPQQNLSINLASVSEFLKNPVRAEALDAPIPDSDLALLKIQMEKAHHAFGIKVIIPDERITELAYGQRERVKRSLVDFIGFLSPELTAEAYASKSGAFDYFNSIINTFFFDLNGKYQAQILEIQEIGQRIESLLSSSEYRNLTKEYRENVRAIMTDPNNRQKRVSTFAVVNKFSASLEKMMYEKIGTDSESLRFCPMLGRMGRTDDP